jgi:hypothetical protein
MDDPTLYIIDASSLIDLHDWRPPNKHRVIWDKLDSLICCDRLMSPEEVYQEIREAKDALARWALRRKRDTQLFTKTVKQCVGIAKQIIHMYPDFVERERPVPQADPFVVALAVLESRKMYAPKCVVVTEEKFTPAGRPRIPHVCAGFHLQYMSIHQMYVAEGWTF